MNHLVRAVNPCFCGLWAAASLMLVVSSGCHRPDGTATSKERTPKPIAVVEDREEKPRELDPLLADEIKAVPNAEKAQSQTDMTPREAAAQLSEPEPRPRVVTANADPPTPEVKPTGVSVDAPVPLGPAPATLHKPEVIMSAGHAATCLVKIGDFLPDIQLPDLSGEMKKLSDLRGARLTVVLFWSTREALGREQFRRFRVETAQLFRSSGVNVVAINVGDDADSVRKLYESAKADFPCLLDKEKSEFGSVATAKLPRTYLLDAQGRIVWLEMEYSCDARRELTNAVYFFLNARPPVEERS